MRAALSGKPTRAYISSRRRTPLVLGSVLGPRGLAAAISALIGGGVALSPSIAVAQPGAPSAELHDLAQQARQAKGPEIYVLLREIWRTWDRADPDQVEETLHVLAEAKGLSPSARVYAGLLSSYARRRRGDLEGSAAQIRRLGFIRDWATVGPFDNENKVGFEREFGPEADIGKAILAGQTYDGRERSTRWRLPPAFPFYGWLDFGNLIRPAESSCAYATTFLKARKGSPSPRPMSLWVGSEGAFKLFWNGENVLSDSGYRKLDVDRHATVASLGSGYGRLTIKVCGSASAPKFALRVADDKGAPDPNVEVSAELETQPATAPQAPAPRAAQKPRSSLLGAQQAFESASEGRPSPRITEAFARYLMLTGGDAEGTHQARDLARRAAEAEPTVRRYLLAGQLAEDRNQQSMWVQRAAALTTTDDIEILLAEARLAQTGPNWRDAVPIYERILALQPDHAIGLLGFADLYTQAGLQRTALSILEDAVNRQPQSVSLLRAYTSQLRSLGRDREASEVEARHAALRFDDSPLLIDLVDLAVARHDDGGAKRWLDRFLAVEHDAVWSQTVAARAYGALGQRDRALASLEAARALAPEDLATLRLLSDHFGDRGDRAKQLETLRLITSISPQAKDVREYIENLAPAKPRADEAYAWTPEQFLRLREAAGKSYPRRTLRNLTVTTVFPNGLASRFKQVVFQPLTDEAAARARQYTFDYQGDRQVVTVRAARVFRRDGKVDEAIENGEGAVNNPDISMYTSARTFYVSFPRLNAGDVVELRYRIEDVSPRNEMADHFGEIEYLQSDEPVGSSEYVLITPKAKWFDVRATGLPGLTRDVKETSDQRIYRMVANQLPPLAPEPGMPAWAEVLGHIHVSTFKSWDDVGTWYWGLVRHQFDVDDEVRKKTREITAGLTDDRSKVRAVYKYATEARYVALEFGLEGIRPRRAAQTLARGWGDCKDKATLIVTMLRELGIPSTIVLVRTGLRGLIPSEPAGLSPFDHAIAYVPSLDLYLDGTAEHTGSMELPAMDRGAIALQINEGKPKLVRLPQPPPSASVLRRHVELVLSTDTSARLKVETEVTGVFAPQWRTRFMAEGTRRARVAQDIASDFGTVDLLAGKNGLDVSDLEDIEKPVQLRARGQIASLGRREGDKLSVPAVPQQNMAADYGSLSTRKLDLVLSSLTSREEEWTFILPANMRVLRMPLVQNVDSPFGSFAITVEETPSKVVVKSRLNLSKARITPAEYKEFLAFCETVDRAFGQRLVVGL
ncbi:DUF3857 domain-containing protein [Chondromyces crocatus]|uniref:Uncharacterized protein n=1 Tax=Chondromyces crocatus TaxID=52 RepID=A0A0K1ERD4_CHOCO|nr:DUF3857 domain-containing protein [Chondromyces crocatus]AKT43384.1 uncharacterized protein CMC5_076160 [Chondromyces crocatus]